VDHTTGSRYSPLGEPDAIKYTTDYVRRLLVERHHIYAKLYNPGGSVILTSTARVDSERGTEYTSMIGSTFHLDLIELDTALKEAIDSGDFNKDEIEALLTWVDGMNSQQAAHYLHAAGPVTIRKRRSRGVRKLTDTLNDGLSTHIGRDGDRPVEDGRQEKTDDSV
jgi:hypothetical protein